MSRWKDKVFEDWWPLGQAMIVACGSFRRVARAMKAQGKEWDRRYGGAYACDRPRLSSLDEVFRSVQRFTGSPTLYYCLPTKTNWTVIWCNSFACTGHDSLAHCLTLFQKLETIHFYSTDRNSTQLAGTHFTHRRPAKGEDMIKRDVYCCNQGSRWHFEQSGDSLPEEDLDCYSAKRKRDRLNEEGMMAFLERLGVQPWLENTYDLRNKCFRMIRKNYPGTESFTFQQIRERAGAPPPPEEDTELVGPPDYLTGRVGQPRSDGPARLLTDGKWCGHGEKTFWIYDVRSGSEDRFTVRLPEPKGVPVVEVTPPSGGDGFAVYDSRRHPASVFVDSEKKPVLQPPEQCPQCGSTVFRVAVGVEVPSDAQSSNDTSWFAMALQCDVCGHDLIAYNDETA